VIKVKRHFKGKVLLPASGLKSMPNKEQARSKQYTACFLLVDWHVLHGCTSSDPRRESLLREPKNQFFGCPSSEANASVAQEA
jgi:hypothetical protein